MDFGLFYKHKIELLHTPFPYIISILRPNNDPQNPPPPYSKSTSNCNSALLEKEKIITRTS